MKTRNYKQYIVGAMLAAVILLGGVLLLNGLAGQSGNKNEQTASASTKQQSSYITYTAKKDETALSQLKRVAEGVTTKQSSYGEYVESIGTLKGGTDGNYWTFYVDGKMASVGADAYVAKGGEKIEWKFEKVQ